MNSRRYRLVLSIVFTSSVLVGVTYLVVVRRINMQHAFFVLFALVMLSYMVQSMLFFACSVLFFTDSDKYPKRSCNANGYSNTNDFGNFKTSLLIILSHFALCAAGIVTFLLLKSKSMIDPALAKVLVTNFLGIFIILFVAEILISIVTLTNSENYVPVHNHDAEHISSDNNYSDYDGGSASAGATARWPAVTSHKQYVNLNACFDDPPPPYEESFCSPSYSNANANFYQSDLSYTTTIEHSRLHGGAPFITPAQMYNANSKTDIPYMNTENDTFASEGDVVPSAPPIWYDEDQSRYL